jgi:hypothetical protein
MIIFSSAEHELNASFGTNIVLYVTIAVIPLYLEIFVDVNFKAKHCFLLSRLRQLNDDILRRD